MTAENVLIHQVVLDKHGQQHEGESALERPSEGPAQPILRVQACPSDSFEASIPPIFVQEKSQADYDQIITQNVLPFEQLTASGNLIVEVDESQRPRLARSSSLEVHAASPTPSDAPLESSASWTEINSDGSYDPRDESITSLIKGSGPLNHQGRSNRFSFSETASERSSFVVLSSQISGTDSRASSVPAPPFSPAQQIRPFTACLPSPQLMTIEEALDDPSPQSYPLQNSMSIMQRRPPEHGRFVASYMPPSMLVTSHRDFPSDCPQPTSANNSKYPPCWVSNDGLLIVPSVPGVLIEDTSQQNITESETVEVMSPTKEKHNLMTENLDIPDDLEIVAALSPNVTAYRKGKHPTRKRGHGFYNADILSHRTKSED